MCNPSPLFIQVYAFCYFRWYFDLIFSHYFIQYIFTGLYTFLFNIVQQKILDNLTVTAFVNSTETGSNNNVELVSKLDAFFFKFAIGLFVSTVVLQFCSNPSFYDFIVELYIYVFK